ncbi:MAG: RNA polymerase sigma factor FliA [Thiobacillus sp.]|uniref:RNA polymerase sigma factor FliA n=1 Tax=Thiobacillus sp. TaxID=924 RepID=UPI00168C4001|nr:RNA polymerase sigma factor FliA [Thiobacillus sp.]QLQ02012.1 MAG: RNA polymerase sigma factor FliA [Thiobacillus sp.]
MYTATGKSEKSEKNDLLAQYMPMVKRLAHHMMGRLPPSVEEDDLVQAGMIGLLDAISRYDEAQSAQFEAYAIQRIRGSMIDELRQSDWMPRARQSMRKIEQAINTLQHKLGRQPSETEISESMKIPLAEYQAMLGDARGHQLLYFEDFGESDEDDSFLDKQSADEASMPLPQLLDANLRACIIAGIENLPEREQLLMSLYYEQELNLREISEVFGVSESRICQLHGQAIARLRAKLKEDAWIVAA